MTEYTGIKGGKVQNFSSDPANPFVGQVWYNTTSSELKVRSSNASGAWTTGGSLNTARGDFSRSWNSNSSFSFWWSYSRWQLQEQTESYNGTSLDRS
jgi:hypothetical protein